MAEAILGELTYELGHKVWSAIVFKSEEGGIPCFTLKVGMGSAPPNYRFAGNFNSGKAVVKYVRAKAKEKFSAYHPTKDTINQLLDRSPTTVIPDCYVRDNAVSGCSNHNLQVASKCHSCPYRFDASAKAAEAGIDLDYEIEEPELSEGRLAQLQEITRQRWGSYEDPEND